MRTGTAEHLFATTTEGNLISTYMDRAPRQTRSEPFVEVLQVPSTLSAPSGKLAIALSGGGSRAIAFHLGCLKALHSAGLLREVVTISCVSGGSLIGALYCSSPGDFSAFETKTRELLAQGLVQKSMRLSVTSMEGVKALSAFLPLGTDRLLAWCARLLLRMLRLGSRKGHGWLFNSPFRRWASRTTILRRALDKILEGRSFSDLRSDRPKLIVVACELQAKSAFYFASEGAGSWRYGLADASSIKLAQAVAASASYPAALPALEEKMTFAKDGMPTSRRVVLTDGGAYDNLGLSPLWPGRDANVSLHVESYDRLIACRGGYDLEVEWSGTFWPARMISVVESLHARTQNLATTRLFDLKKSGAIRDFLLPYLGQSDARLKFAPSDLVTREAVAGYPTNFSAMPDLWIDRLSRRGEQLTLALIAEHGWQSTE